MYRMCESTLTNVHTTQVKEAVNERSASWTIAQKHYSILQCSVMQLSKNDTITWNLGIIIVFVGHFPFYTAPVFKNAFDTIRERWGYLVQQMCRTCLLLCKKRLYMSFPLFWICSHGSFFQALPKKPQYEVTEKEFLYQCCSIRMSIMYYNTFSKGLISGQPFAVCIWCHFDLKKIHI